MQTKQDVESRSDIEGVLRTFYQKVLDDAIIGHYFTKVAPINLDTHIPVITDFWESVLLGSGVYRKNVMELHRHIHEKLAIEKPQLDQWVALFAQTIDEQFSGPQAETMKQRARSIATLMDIRLNHNGFGPEKPKAPNP